MIKKGDVLENLAITGFASEGKAVARVENFVVFVENAVPGDVGNVAGDTRICGHIAVDVGPPRIQYLSVGRDVSVLLAFRGVV